MRAPLIAVIAWSSLAVANFSDVEVYPGNGDSGISFYGNWKTISDDCGSAFVASAVGDALAYSFQGAAVYVLGTVSCGWPGLLSISVDGVFNTTIDRCNCDVAGASGHICRFPWLAKDGLDPNVEHMLSLTLIGPALQQNSSGQVVAELRSIKYLVPMQPTDSTDDNTPDDSTPSTMTSMIALPTSAESSDAPLPQLATLHLSTAATAGIIISVVLFFLFALFLCIYLRRRSQQRRRQQHRDGTTTPAMSSRARYPTEHLSWSPAAERLEARAQQAAAGRRRSSSSGGSIGRSWGSARRRMDSIPEAPDDHHPSVPAAAAAAEGSRRAGERSRSFSWSDGSSPGSSPEEGLLRDSESVVYSAVAPTRLAFPAAAAAGEYWTRRMSRGSGRYSAPQSPLRKSLVPGDEESGSAS